jgi:hypothetical protein
VEFLQEPSRSVTLDPQLMWANILVICACLLLAMALLTCAVEWGRPLSRLARLSALLPLAASVAVAILAHHLYDLYSYWNHYLYVTLFTTRATDNPVFVDRLFNEIVSANQQATVLGWIGVMVTGIVLTPSLLGMWYLLRKAAT